MKKRLFFLLLSSSFILTACQNKTSDSEQELANQSSDQVEETGRPSNNTIVTTENQLGEKYYRPLLVEGSYQPSNSRGITLRLNSAVNLKTFETGLMLLSTDYFPTQNHLFQEGQLISEESIRSWIRRKDDEHNSEGLNPVDNQKKEPTERNPIYLQSILEQDYYVETESGPKLGGISIGLALNQVDYYTKEQFGAEFETKIPREDLLKKGKEMADQLVLRIREIEGAGEVPITVALFEQAPRDHFGGGVFFSQGISKKGSTSINEWIEINERKEVFPLTGNDTSEGNSFKNFKSEVETFFPNLSGITGIAEYRNDEMKHLDISIVTQFYGAGEMIAFTQFVQDAASKYLPPNIETEITVESMEGTEAFLFRKTGGSTFEGHVFNK